mgnify:CR=1 FL=1
MPSRAPTSMASPFAPAVVARGSPSANVSPTAIPSPPHLLGQGSRAPLRRIAWRRLERRARHGDDVELAADAARMDPNVHVIVLRGAGVGVRVIEFVALFFFDFHGERIHYYPLFC